MRELTIVRHGKSAYPEGVDDWSRPLGERGQREVPHLGQVLASLVAHPVTVLVSTAVRAQETWSLLRPWFPTSTCQSLDDLYEASARDIVDLLRRWSVPRLMVVGHNPGLEEAVAWLTQNPASLPTGSAFVLRETASSSWQMAAFLRGRYLQDSREMRGS